MKSVFIKETKGTPRIELNEDGTLFILGRSLPLDPVGFYNPVIKWIKSCEISDITLNIRLDYLNTSSAKQLYTILACLKEKQQIIKLSIHWYYEEGDEDGYDTGREFEALIGIPFMFHEYAEVLD